MQTGAEIALVLMTTGAIAMPAVARKIAIPVAITEILYGVAIGPSGFNVAGDPSDPFIVFLAELGFAFFLFLAGLEIDFRGFERKVGSWLLPALVSMAAFGLAVGACSFLGWGLWVGLALGATAVPLLLAVVRELKLNGTDLGRTMVSFAAMGELLTIGFLSLLEISEHSHSVGEVAAGLGRLGLLSLVFAVVVVLLRTLLWWYPKPFTRIVAHDDPSEFGVRVGFGLMFVFIGLAMMAKVEPFLGSFLAGALLSFVVREAEALEHKLASIAYGFFVPVFFIHVGLRLEVTLQLILDNIVQIGTIVLIMALAKQVPGLLLLRRGLSFRQATATSLLLAAPLTLVIAIMDLGSRAGAVDPETEVVVITAGILASLLFPSLARRMLRDEATPQAAAAGH